MKKSVNRWKSKAFSKRDRAGSESSLATPHSGQGPTLHDSTSVHRWVGKDYVNWITSDIYQANAPFSDTVDRNVTPRMPWHDVALAVAGHAATDVARHFIQRWNAVKNEKAKSNAGYPYLLPRSYARGGASPAVQFPCVNKYTVKCQVLRSVCEWSGGQQDAERSIYTAYHSAIQASQHYIYVENQFFISMCGAGPHAEVRNRIGAALVDRIVKAHREGGAFRLYVTLPLLPAFEGQVGTPTGTAIQSILHHTYASLCRGDNSFVSQCESRGVANWRDYVCFCSLRSHDTLEGKHVTELVYIHSKLLIVDDRLVIAGSANINDRSMLGTRDSEVCLLIEDQDFEPGVMNGKAYSRGKFAYSMRKYLFSEHLGLIGDEESAAGKAGSVGNPGRPTMRDIEDPVSERFFKDIWCGIASVNTNIYSQVFNAYPSDAAKSFAELAKLRNKEKLAETNWEKAGERLRGIQGNLVEFPLKFLEEEALKPGLGTKEGLLPIETWT